MDPVSHAIFGRLLVTLGPPERIARPVAIAAVLGALAPDVDAVFMPAGWDVYLRVHEIGTHSIAGASVVAAVTAAFVKLFARTQAFRVLLAAAAIGVASHLWFDVGSGATIRLLWPVADFQATAPLVAMADPWLLGLLLLVAVALVVARTRRRAVAVGGTVAVAVFFVAKGLLLTRTVVLYRDEVRREQTAGRMMQVEWGSLSRWLVYDRTGTRLRQLRIDAVKGTVETRLVHEVAAGAGLVQASRALPAVRNFARAHHLGFPIVVSGPSGGSRVLWSDVRFCWDPTAPGRPSPPVGSPLRPGPEPIACGVWVGGEFDASGRAVRQIVTVGEIIQTRPVDGGEWLSPVG